MTRSSDAGRAGRREWMGLAVLALPCLLVAVDLTVLNLAVPRLSADLRPSSAQLLWIVDIYGFMIAGSLITMGTLGDRIGRRRLLLLGAAAFGTVSVLASLSINAEMLILTRALLGIAGATLMPSTLSLIRGMFPDPAQRTVAIGAWVTSLSVGSAIGPLLGGALLELFGWRAVFLMAVPVVVLLLTVGPKLLPEFRALSAGRLDLVSAALSLAAVLAAIYGIKRIAGDGPAWSSIACIVGGLAAGAVFAHRQGRLADPLLDLGLLRMPAFSASLAANTLALFGLIGTDFFVGQYLQLVLGMGPFQAGLWLLPSSGGVLVGSMFAPTASRWFRPAHVVAAGLVLGALGAGVLTRVDGTAGLASLVAGSTIMTIGLALVATLGTDLIVSAAPSERAGAASAISETGTELGGALGIAVLGSIGTAVYRGEISSALPAGVPALAADAARQTLGGAVSVADQLPAGILSLANIAFAHGLQVAAVTSAGALLVTAAVVLLALREERMTSPVDAAAEPGVRVAGPVAA